MVWAEVILQDLTLQGFHYLQIGLVQQKDSQSAAIPQVSLVLTFFQVLFLFLVNMGGYSVIQGWFRGCIFLIYTLFPLSFCLVCACADLGCKLRSEGLGFSSVHFFTNLLIMQTPPPGRGVHPPLQINPLTLSAKMLAFSSLIKVLCQSSRGWEVSPGKKASDSAPRTSSSSSSLINTSQVLTQTWQLETLLVVM